MTNLGTTEKKCVQQSYIKVWRTRLCLWTRVIIFSQTRCVVSVIMCYYIIEVKYNKT